MDLRETVEWWRRWGGGDILNHLGGVLGLERYCGFGSLGECSGFIGTL